MSVLRFLLLLLVRHLGVLVSLFGKGQLFSSVRDYRSAVVTTHAGFPDVSSVSSVPQFSLPLLSFYLVRFFLLRLWILFGVFLSS